MIVSFRHKGLERFYRTGSKAGIQAAHEARLRLILGVLDQATSEDDVKALHGLRAHRLSGKEKDFMRCLDACLASSPEEPFESLVPKADDHAPM